MKKTLDAAQESLTTTIAKFNKKQQAKTKAQQAVDSLDKELTELQIQITRLRDYILKITQ
jgi:predicted  nucleic acid-binding Zn-ribbon protein